MIGPDNNPPPIQNNSLKKGYSNLVIISNHLDFNSRGFGRNLCIIVLEEGWNLKAYQIRSADLNVRTNFLPFFSPLFWHFERVEFFIIIFPCHPNRIIRTVQNWLQSFVKKKLKFIFLKFFFTSCTSIVTVNFFFFNKNFGN